MRRREEYEHRPKNNRRKTMKYPMPTTIKHAIVASAIALAVSHSLRADLSAFHPADSSQQPAAESCTTVRPGPDWTCANGNWYPPGMPIPAGPPQATVTGQDQAPDRSLAGVWLVKITPRNCATGVPIPTGAFEALFPFHEDKTMLVSLRNNTLTLERTAAHGLWRRDLGWSDYSFKFVHIRRNVSTGAFAGMQESGGTLVLAESGDEFTTDASTTVFDVNGNPVGASSCSNSVGTRFKLEL
jgi:hypothetical protein